MDPSKSPSISPVPPLPSEIEKPVHFPAVLSGFEKQQIEANAEKKRVVYLMLVVCGIGPHDKKLDKHLATLKETADIVRRVHFEHLTEEQFRIDFVSDDWRGYLHKTVDISGIDETITACAPHTLGAIRGFINNIGVDVLYYLTSSHRQRFLNAVYKSLNDCYRKYMTEKAAYIAGAEVYVGLFAHSLGSVVCFDLLSGPSSGGIPGSPPPFHASPLEFPVHSFFAFGSAIPLFLSLRGTSLGWFSDSKTSTPVTVTPSYTPLSPSPDGLGGVSGSVGSMGSTPMTTQGSVDDFGSNQVLGLESLPRTLLPYCAFFYNVYHPHDPVAYRIDPLVRADLKGTEPLYVPHWRTLGSRRHVHMGTLAKTLMKSTAAITKHAAERASQTHTDAMMNARFTGRFDFQLQPKATHAVSNYAAMVQVHNKYWGSKDTILFVMTQCLRHAFLDIPTVIGNLRPLHGTASSSPTNSTRGAINGAGGMQIFAPSLQSSITSTHSSNSLQSSTMSSVSTQPLTATSSSVTAPTSHQGNSPGIFHRITHSLHRKHSKDESGSVSSVVSPATGIVRSPSSGMPASPTPTHTVPTYMMHGLSTSSSSVVTSNNGKLASGGWEWEHAAARPHTPTLSPNQRPSTLDVGSPYRSPSSSTAPVVAVQPKGVWDQQPLSLVVSAVDGNVERRGFGDEGVSRSHSRGGSPTAFYASSIHSSASGATPSVQSAAAQRGGYSPHQR